MHALWLFYLAPVNTPIQFITDSSLSFMFSDSLIHFSLSLFYLCFKLQKLGSNSNSKYTAVFLSLARWRECSILGQLTQCKLTIRDLNLNFNYPRGMYHIKQSKILYETEFFKNVSYVKHTLLIIIIIPNEWLNYVSLWLSTLFCHTW